jgi:hypothetical protein
MISKCIAFLAAALLLANCCALGTGCAPAANAPLAWDGLGSAPTVEDQTVEPRPKKLAHVNRENVVSPLQDATTASVRKPEPSWAQQQAVDEADEARLKRKLIICRNCVGDQSASAREKPSRTDAQRRADD